MKDHYQMIFNKRTSMKIKAYLTNGKYKIIKIEVTDDVKTIANTYERWEYIL